MYAIGSLRAPWLYWFSRGERSLLINLPRISTMKIHPTAVVSTNADLDHNVEIGPLAIVESGVRIGSGCRLAGQVVVKKNTTIGADTMIHEGAVIGGLPQHTNMPEHCGRVVVGCRNTFREHVTVHRGLNEDGVTRIGDDCLLMVGAHIAHDCTIGSRVILTNHVLVGGFVEIGDRACLGGGAAIHQFCRIGRFAMVAGCARVVQDVPPFVLTDGQSGMVVGLNRVGLRRAGFDRHDLAQLKQAYQLIYRQGMSHEDTLKALNAEFQEGPASEFAPFFSKGKRGFVQERRCPPKASIRLHRSDDAETGKNGKVANRQAG
jgi:UDP-N-acetylglucosamine acyltransferase